MKTKLSPTDCKELLHVLKTRFEQYTSRHQSLEWEHVQARLENNSDKLWSLSEMEKTGGEPDVIGFDVGTGEYIFCDCSSQSPKGRRSVCYDYAGQESRKDFKPQHNVLDMAAKMKIELLTEQSYRDLQKLVTFDTKTSSWIQTPVEIRKLGGALFAEFRYGQVFVFHNSAPSYYSSRGFRGLLKV